MIDAQQSRCPLCQERHAYVERNGLRVWLCPDAPEDRVLVAPGHAYSVEHVKRVRED